MIDILIRCDVCNKALPIKTIETIETKFGSVDTVKNSKTKIWDTSHLFKYLCEECALRMDNSFLIAKLGLPK